MTVYPGAATWTVGGVFIHLIATEKDYLRLFENVRRGGPGAREGFDIDDHNARRLREAGALKLADLAAEFRAARARMVDFVSGLTELDLARSGRHPYLGVVTLREMVKMVYIHNEIHHRDVRHNLING